MHSAKLHNYVRKVYFEPQYQNIRCKHEQQLIQVLKQWLLSLLFLPKLSSLLELLASAVDLELAQNFNAGATRTVTGGASNGSAMAPPGISVQGVRPPTSPQTRAQYAPQPVSLLSGLGAPGLGGARGGGAGAADSTTFGDST